MRWREAKRMAVLTEFPWQPKKCNKCKLEMFYIPAFMVICTIQCNNFVRCEADYTKWPTNDRKVMDGMFMRRKNTSLPFQSLFFTQRCAISIISLEPIATEIGTVLCILKFYMCLADRPVNLLRPAGFSFNFICLTLSCAIFLNSNQINIFYKFWHWKTLHILSFSK